MENFIPDPQQDKTVAETAEKVMDKIEKTVVGGYKKIEHGVVSGYQKIEDGVVDGFNKMTDKIVEKFLTKEGETVEQAKERMRNSVQDK